MRPCNIFRAKLQALSTRTQLRLERRGEHGVQHGELPLAGLLGRLRGAIHEELEEAAIRQQRSNAPGTVLRCHRAHDVEHGRPQLLERLLQRVHELHHRGLLRALGTQAVEQALTHAPNARVLRRNLIGLLRQSRVCTENARERVETVRLHGHFHTATKL